MYLYKKSGYVIEQYVKTVAIMSFLLRDNEVFLKSNAHESCAIFCNEFHARVHTTFQIDDILLLREAINDEVVQVTRHI